MFNSLSSIRKYLSVVLIVIVVADCGSQSKEKDIAVIKKEVRTIVTEVHLTESVEEVEPPSYNLTTKFKSLEDWLINLCDKEGSKTLISTYRFGVFEAKDSYVVFLVGLNSYGDSTKSSIQIDYVPVHGYYALPENEFKNLKSSQVFSKLTQDLKNFTNTDKFKGSFFAKAKQIKTDFSGIIWTNKELM